MTILTAPETLANNSGDYYWPSVFLAGGISNCPDWQATVIAILSCNKQLVVYNPRRPEFDVTDPNVTEQQIRWEYTALLNSDILLFWFAEGSINPIALYELGMWANSRETRPLFVGIDPNYPRATDVKMQTHLARPDVKIVGSLSELALQVNRYLKKIKTGSWQE